GGGAAGLMCALEAGRRGRSVLVLERNDELGRKILISGGGRCNFTNVNAGPENYFSQNPHFARSVLARYPAARFIEMVEAHGIAYHEKKLGQLFCDGSASQIVDMLADECVDAGVEIMVGCDVVDVTRRDGFVVATGTRTFVGESLVIASGGLSIPKIGATGFGYRVAEQFGLRRVAVRPGLVPLTFSREEHLFFERLSGVAVEATVSCEGISFTENVLFTHRGLSGPAILQVSSAWREGRPIFVDLLPRESALEVLDAARDDARELVTVLGEHLPKRFAQAWCAAYAPSRQMRRYSTTEIEAIAQRLERWELVPAGTAGYAKAEVTLGGVDTDELRSTMESRKVPGLYFIGEVVDVTGWLGGYNFQWAWASGYVAGQNA
ncbi:MAG: NAD(P)/FAD-dependent oxidoreductase, partial [Tepidiformaceae bacterium]